MADRTKSVLLAHPQLAFGGSEVVVAWIAQALASADYRVTLATVGTVALDRVDRFAGTRLSNAEDRIEIMALPAPAGALGKMAAVRGAMFARQVRAIAAKYHVAISGYEFLPFGVPGIHYIHGDASDFRDSVGQDGYHTVRSAFQRPGPLRGAYLGLCGVIAGGGAAEPSDADILIANSSLTARNVYKRWHKPAEVIHPAAPTTAAGLPWHARKNTVVMLGRIEPSKRVLEGIEIVRALRERKHDLQMEIAGPWLDNSYQREILEHSRGHASWLKFRGILDSGQKSALLGSSRFLLHCKRSEPFGIGIVEAARSGCLCVFPRGGGYEDFVTDDTLLYGDPGDAIDKFDALLGQGECELEERQKRLRKDATSVGRDFEQRIVAVVERFATGKRLAATCI